MFTITARDMITAQSFEITPAERAELKSMADTYRRITGGTAKTNINVPVIDFYGAKIGQLTYWL